jgi:hypothetical protein
MLFPLNLGLDIFAALCAGAFNAHAGVSHLTVKIVGPASRAITSFGGFEDWADYFGWHYDFDSPWVSPPGTFACVTSFIDSREVVVLPGEPA